MYNFYTYVNTFYMITIIAYIIVILGSVNWLSIGFFQYDLVAGLFGYQGSIFSRIVYIFVGICAIYLTYSLIKHKGKISVRRLKKEEKLPNFNQDNTNNQNNNLNNNIDNQNNNSNNNVNNSSFNNNHQSNNNNNNYSANNINNSNS